MKRSQATAIKSAPGECGLFVVETDTRDCICAGTATDTTTIAYVAIGAEAWGGLLAAAPDMLAALREAEQFMLKVKPDSRRLAIVRAAIAKAVQS